MGEAGPSRLHCVQERQAGVRAVAVAVVMTGSALLIETCSSKPAQLILLAPSVTGLLATRLPIYGAIVTMECVAHRAMKSLNQNLAKDARNDTTRSSQFPTFTKTCT